MKTYFADTFYCQALFDPRDKHHERVTNWTKGKRYRTVTTEFVLTEVGDEFRKSPLRAVFLALLEQLRRDGLVEIVPAAPE